MTTYDLFVHYYNDTIGKAVTNTVDCKWYPADTTIGKYTGNDKDENADEYLSVDYLLSRTTNQKDSKYYKQEEVLEHLYISSSDKDKANLDTNTEIYQKLIIDSSTIQNPKYDMIFVWDGLGYHTSQYADESNVQLYYDKMKRVSFRPWFFHSIYHSLAAVMTTAQKLVDLFGKDHVMMGKEVNLKQYIEIV